MDRKDFLEGLRAYLEPEVSAQVVQENIYYYERYITEEVIKGRREEAVVEELGDPWILAKTIIDMEEAKQNAKSGYESETENIYNEKKGKAIFSNPFWKRLALMLIIVGVLVVAVSLLTGLIGLFMPIIMPVLLVVMIHRLIGSRRRY